MNSSDMSYCNLLLVLLLLVSVQQQLANGLQMIPITVNFFRLPGNFRPSNYIINLRPNLEKGECMGEVVIQLEIPTVDKSVNLMNERGISDQMHILASDPKNIILKASELIVTNAVFKQDARQEVMERIFHDPINQILIVTLSERPDSSRPAELTFNFKAAVQREPKSLFMSQVDRNQWMLATNLAPAYASWLFPCFDEPQFKATFELTVEHGKGTTAMSNMKILSSATLLGGSMITTFNRTPKMSSYMLSLVVGRFSSTKPAWYGNVPITIHAPIGWPCNPSKMLHMARQFYETATAFFTQLHLPLEKIDIVAVNTKPIPMGNWGLISMNWELLSADPLTSKPDEWMRAVTNLMKKMVRFWIGNLVTMRWWDDLWLIEGLSSYLANELISRERPDIRSQMFTLIDTTVSALNIEDIRGMARAIKDVSLRTADDIVNRYNLLTYTKSEAILRMYSNLVGKEKFDSAIRGLISSYALKVVEAKNWWSNLESHAPEHVGIIREAYRWIEQPGYPIIYITLNTRSMVVSQSSNLHNMNSVWLVPISYELHGTPGSNCYEFDRLYLSGTEMKIDLPGWFNLKGKFNFLQVNVHYEGYYRVVYNYKPSMNALVRAVKFMSVIRETSDILRILSDFYADFKRTGSILYFLDLLRALAEEKESGQLQDEVILLLTRMLNEMHKIGKFHSDLLVPTATLMLNYFTKRRQLDEVSHYDTLRQCTRSYVVDYLANRLNNMAVIKQLMFLKNSRARIPPFLQLAIGNLRASES